MPKFKKIKVESYKPGRFKIKSLRKVIKLSSNESALGVSSRVKKAIQKGQKDIIKYPDNNSINLRKEIAKKFKCNFDKIICGNGSDEIIKIICELFLKPNDEVIVPQYSFLMYRIYASISGAKVLFSKENNFKISINEVLNKVNKRTKIVFLANPNNPTGTYLSKLELTQLRKRLKKNILLVVDDAYFEYMKKKNYTSGLDLFKNKENVIVLRTFSKIHGLASLRVGWGYGSKRIINAMYKIKPPFNVNKIGQYCAIESLKDNDFIKKSVRHNFLWAVKISKELKKFNIQTNETSGNFFLLNFNKAKFSAHHVFNKLEKKGIILRDMNAYKIKNALRLTIGSSFANKEFIKCLRNIFNR